LHLKLYANLNLVILKVRRKTMKKHATVMAMGALLTLVMTATSFAASHGVAERHRTSAGDPYASYYDSAAGSSGYDDFSSGANSGSMGARGR
jgi:hypothetical protein